MILSAGCNGRVKDKYQLEIDDNTVEGLIDYETSTLGIDSKSKDFESKLTNGTYYVVHDDIWYPLVYYVTNFTNAPGETVNPDRQMYFTTSNENQIPTLFEGDKLVYYSTDQLLDYVVFERYKEIGYTIGLFDIRNMTSDRCYVFLGDDNESILTGTDLEELYDLNVENALIDKIAGEKFTSDMVEDGLVAGMSKLKTYDIDVYAGTYYKHFLTTANVRAFKAYELYASVEYDTMKSYLYEIKIPEYFLDGYYYIYNCGMFRYVKSNEYYDGPEYIGQFNEQLLYPAVDIYSEDDEYIAPALYSDFDALNKFTTNIEGKFGYVEDTVEDTKEEEKEVSKTILQEAVVKKIELYAPKDKECKIEIVSSSGETSGDIYIVYPDNKLKFVNYSKIEKEYILDFTGSDEKVVLVVSGLTNDYSITLTNCEQYTGQDLVTEDESQDDNNSERRR